MNTDRLVGEGLLHERDPADLRNGWELAAGAGCQGFHFGSECDPPDRWSLRFDEAVVSRCSFDWGVTWLISSHGETFEVRVEQPLEFGSNEPVSLVPGEDLSLLAPLLETVHASVVRIDACTAGCLEVEFGSGATIRVRPSEAFEAWTVAGPGEAKLVSSPGGDLVTWGLSSGISAAAVGSGDRIDPLGH